MSGLKNKDELLDMISAALEDQELKSAEKKQQNIYAEVISNEIYQ